MTFLFARGGHPLAGRSEKPVPKLKVFGQLGEANALARVVYAFLIGEKHRGGAVTDRKFPSSPRYLKKSLDRNTTGPSAWTGRSKNLRDARSSIASRSRRN